MNTKLLVVLSGLAVCSASIWFAIHARSRSNESIAALRLLEQKAANLAAGNQKAQQLLAAAAERNSELKSKLADLLKETPVATAAATPAPVKAPTARELLLNDPHLQALWVASTRAKLARSYGPLYSAMRLTPEQIGRLEAALVEREESELDLAAAAQSQSSDSERAIATLRKTTDDEFTAAVRDVLGEDGPDKLKEFDRSSAIQALVTRIGGAASLEDAALTPLQAEQLTQIITRIGGSSGDARIDLAKVDWGQVDTQARLVLSPAQLGILRRSRADLELDAAISKAKADDSIPAPAVKSGSS